MYRKRNGSLGFSFGTFIQNAVPNLVLNSRDSGWCQELGQDILYGHQLASRHTGSPFALDERSFFVGGICEGEGVSVKIFNRLSRAGILDELGCVNTHKIEGKKFPHQIAVLSQPRQRDLINLLFWWEEECQRLRKLFAEKQDLDEQIELLGENRQDRAEEHDSHADFAGDDQERKQLLDRLRFERNKTLMRIHQRPSQRRQDVEDGTDNLYGEAYAANVSGRSQSVPNMPMQGESQHPELPAYRP